MTRFTTLIAALAMSSSPAAGAEPARSLNLLLITADDMNADSSGWMGSKLGATPQLDAFAANAHRFVNHHVSAPICQPSRSALMTGRVPHRNGALGFNPIRKDVPTLVEVLAARGYFTAAVNKIEHMAPREKFPWDLALGGSGKNPEAMGEHVAQCLKAAANAKKPFFINANITDPHRPFPGADGPSVQPEPNQRNPAEIQPYVPADVMVPSFLEDVPDVRREVAEYYTAVRRFDQSFGRVLTALRSGGHADDTLIIFLSDNGMSFPFSKATVYRNGTWSPVLLRWPGMSLPETHEDLVGSVDLMPTVLDILSIAKPEGLDGRSWRQLFRGEKQAGRDHVVTHVNTVSSGSSFPQRSVRTRTRSLMFHAWSDGQARFRVDAMNGRTFKALEEAAKGDDRIKARVEQYVAGTPLALYDLERDPDERHNLINDPRYREDVKRLAELLRTHMERTSDPQREFFRTLVSGARR